jgi:hypothetical protein
VVYGIIDLPHGQLNFASTKKKTPGDAQKRHLASILKKD